MKILSKLENEKQDYVETLIVSVKSLFFSWRYDNFLIIFCKNF